MTLNPILKVLSTLHMNRVNYLLMGGQACVYYGAAEFSRDTDVAILAEAENLKRLAAALEDLQAKVIAVPPFDLEYLKRGHAVHFRCAHPEAQGMRLDVMSVMRGLPPFSVLWGRRTTAEMALGASIELLSLPDLVSAKKTQRDKDWPMIRRLVESDYQRTRGGPTLTQVRFYAREARTPALLRELASGFPEEVRKISPDRALLKLLPDAPDEEIEQALICEQQEEREMDKLYWKPLRKELEQLRWARSGED